MKQNENNVTAVALLFAAIYTVSYLTRVNFGAIISEMERATLIPKALLSLSLTGSFFTYGLGQILSGIAVDRISPKKMISTGLLVTAGMNLLIPLCKDPYAMLAVWCVNGFAQSMMWPPIVKMMSQMFHDKDYRKAAVIVSWGSSVGTMLVYLLAPLVMRLLNWQWVFFLAAGAAVLTVILWQGFSFRPETITIPKTGEKGRIGVLFTPLMLCVMVSIVLQGMLRDGVTTWMPSYIIETYHWSTASSILTGVLLPIFSILCFQAASWLYGRVFQNPLTCAGAFFAGGAVSAIFLYFVTGGNAALSVLFSALLTGTMHGVNMMLISMLPPYFKRFGLTGTASGVLNACTYVGSAISTYGVAVLSQTAGWKATVLIWTAVAALGMVLCFACIRGFKKQFS